MTERIAETEYKKGYKKTKLGWIPEDWNIKHLGDLCTKNISNGIFNNPNKVGRGYKLINVIDLYSEPNIKTEDLNLLDATADEVLNFSAQKGDILFTRSSLKLDGIAHCNIFDSDEKDILFECHIIKVRPKINEIIPKYLNNYCKINISRKYFMQKAKTTTMTTIDQQTLAKLLVIFPSSIKEQEKIAEILSAWDEGIETLEKLIETKKRYLKNIAIKLLSKGTNCLEWKEFSLGSISIPINEKVGEKTLPVLSITAGRGFVLQADKFGKNIAGNQYKNYTLLHKNEFSYNKGNSKKYAQGCIYCLKEYEEASVPNVFISFKLKNEIALNEYFEQLFKYNFHGVKLKKYINSGVRDDGLLNLNSNNFFKIKFKIPQIDEQQKIVNILNSYDEEIQILNSKLEKLKEQKKGLMQQLLTGKIRVKV